MKKHIFILLLLIYSPLSQVHAKDALNILFLGLLGIPLRSLPFGKSHQPIKTPPWLPNVLKINYHNIREGVIQALKAGFLIVGVGGNIVKERKNDTSFNEKNIGYSFFNIKSKNRDFTSQKLQNLEKNLNKGTHSIYGATGYAHEFPNQSSWLNSIPAGMLIEGINGTITDNIMDHGSDIAQSLIQNVEKKQPINSQIKKVVIAGARTISSGAWALVISGLRQLKNKDVSSKDVLNGLSVQVRFEYDQGFKADVVIRA